MFEKKCPRCKNKVSRGFAYCPYCSLKLSKRDGLLDNIEEEFDAFEKNDIDDIERLTKEIGKSMGFDFIDKFPFNQIVKRLSKDIEKQFKDIDKEIAMKKFRGKEESVKSNGTEIRKTTFPGGFSIQIRIGGGTPVQTPMQISQPSQRQSATKQILRQPRELNEREMEKLAKLPREEPETKVRRLTDKIIYEIHLPGVKSLKNITVNKLENSIEIKAISKDRAYFKLIPIALPLIRYYLKKESLFLELKP
jgi:hypothetical protein